METLKIQIPKGFEVESFDKATGEVRFREKPKIALERIKTLDDVFADNGLTEAQFDLDCEGLSQDERAYKQLKLVAKSLNEGWTPDWNNNREAKWYPWFYMDGGSSGFRLHDYDDWSSGSAVGSRLCFKSKALAEHAVKHFFEVYKQFFVIE